VYYFIPPESGRDGWPLNGNHIWVRDVPGDDVDAEAIAQRSEAIFKRQFPEQVLPSRVWGMVRSRGGRGDGSRAIQGDDGASWRVPL
jgi:hypothetical protein